MRIEALTFLRFFAAVTVVFFHFARGLYPGEAYARFQNLGPEMVTFFFALSGFVMMLASHAKADLSAWKYYRARIARIYPVYLVAFLWALYYFGGKAYHHGSGYMLNDTKAVVLGATLLQSWVPPYPMSLNAPAWSLSVEAFFYLSFPLVLWGMRRWSLTPRAFFGFSLGFYLITQVVLSWLLATQYVAPHVARTHDLVFYFPLSHFCSFLLGMGGGHLFTTRPQLFQHRGWKPGAALGGAFLVTSAALYFQPEIVALSPAPLAYDASFYSPLFILFILTVAGADNFVTRGLSWKPLVVLGNASYALYILQRPAFFWYGRNLGRNFPDAQERFWVYLVLLVALSVVVYYLIEKPAQRLLLKVLRVRQEGGRRAKKDRGNRKGR